VDLFLNKTAWETYDCIKSQSLEWLLNCHTDLINAKHKEGHDSADWDGSPSTSGNEAEREQGQPDNLKDSTSGFTESDKLVTRSETDITNTREHKFTSRRIRSLLTRKREV
jgi:hypothetical protein